MGRRRSRDKAGVFRAKTPKWEAGAENPLKWREFQDARAVAWFRARMIATVASISRIWSAEDFSGQIC